MNYELPVRKRDLMMKLKAKSYKNTNDYLSESKRQPYEKEIEALLKPEMGMVFSSRVKCGFKCKDIILAVLPRLIFIGNW